VKKPTPPESCTSVPQKVLVKDGVRFLHVTLPDSNVIIVNLDTLPAASNSAAAGSAAAPPSPAGSGSGGGSFNQVCPCEEDPCRPLCYQLRQLAGSGANLCPPPPAAPPH
jgi:hypothetical protein